MKIAIVTPYIYGVGGVESFNSTIKDIFEDNNHQVIIFGKEMIKNNILHKLFKKKADIIKEIGILFEKVAKKSYFDLVICNGEFGAYVNHPRAIIVFHGSYYGYTNAIEEYISEQAFQDGMKLSKLQINAAQNKFVLTVSNANKNVLIKQGIHVDKVITNCINTQLFRPKHEIKRGDTALFVGRYDYYGKGIDVLEKIADRGYQTQCVTNKKMSYANIEPVDFVPYDKMNRRYYQQAGYLLSPSRFESGPLTVIEAMACGTPVVISDLGFGNDIKKVIPEFVVSGFNPDDYCEKIDLVLSDKRKYSNYAIEYVQNHHNYQSFQKEWLQLIEGF